MSTYIPRSKRTFALTFQGDFPLWCLLLSSSVVECLIVIRSFCMHVSEMEAGSY
ncbi:hypothetical protein HanIR_Chr05g0229931 [Helianthus annuus]|nr:hypothetical protein HanIR_Chr05g0229931 [Helianthus annuus]